MLKRSLMFLDKKNGVYKMGKFENVECAICNSSNNLESITDKGQFGILTFVSICKKCGLSFLNPRWNQATYLDFYTKKYDKYYRTFKNTKDPKVDPVSYYPIIRRLKSTFNLNQKIGNVLDIGSGDGSKLNNFIENGIGESYYAIEPSAPYKAKLKAKRIHFVSNDVDSDWDKNYPNYFDMIIMRHVLEHCLDPLQVLQKLRNVLTKNGILYIAVPNAYQPNGSFTDYFFRVVHTYYFNKISLKNILHKSGYEIVSLLEGDQHHRDELFVFAKKTEEVLPLEIDPKTYEIQRKIFVDGLKKEEQLSYKTKRVLRKIVTRIVKLKKRVFPNPIIKN